MRCKCGFNSFDHNLVCPKCLKDLTVTRRLLNLEVPAPGRINFFQIAGQRMATPLPFLGAAGGGEDEDLRPLEDIQPETSGDSQPDEPIIEIEITDDFEAEPSEGGAQPEPASAPFNPPSAHQAAMEQIKSALAETGDLNSEGEETPGSGIPEPAAAAGEAGEGGGDDLASLVSSLNLDELEGDL